MAVVADISSMILFRFCDINTSRILSHKKSSQATIEGSDCFSSSLRNTTDELAPTVDWLLYSAVRKEALLTSQIEGTQATLTDLFDEEAGFKVSNTDDVAEVSNYIRAFRLVREQLRDPKGLPISVRLLCDAHQLLLDGARGAGKQPGELRHSQNRIGGARPGNAVFASPPPERVPELLFNLERFIHDTKDELPALVKIVPVHAHFETIHPFLDGNGRIGRLLIAVLPEHRRLPAEPLICLSGYLKNTKPSATAVCR